MQKIFIDHFIVPKSASAEFLQQMHYNRNFIRKLSGFITDAAYEQTDDAGNINVVTVAVWDSEEALRKAKELVQFEYKRIGFDPSEMLARLNITMNRGIYSEITL